MNYLIISAIVTLILGLVYKLGECNGRIKQAIMDDERITTR